MKLSNGMGSIYKLSGKRRSIRTASAQSRKELQSVIITQRKKRFKR